jgi:hypothetical protein
VLPVLQHHAVGDEDHVPDVVGDAAVDAEHQVDGEPGPLFQLGAHPEDIDVAQRGGGAGLALEAQAVEQHRLRGVRFRNRVMPVLDVVAVQLGDAQPDDVPQRVPGLEHALHNVLHHFADSCNLLELLGCQEAHRVAPESDQVLGLLLLDVLDSDIPNAGLDRPLDRERGQDDAQDHSCF